jgi:hypothetical protein
MGLPTARRGEVLVDGPSIGSRRGREAKSGRKYLSLSLTLAQAKLEDEPRPADDDIPF